MPVKPMLGKVELQLVQKVDAEETDVLAQHGVPALEGDFLQDLGRRAERVTLTGVITGPEAGDGLKTLREQFRGAEPVSFVADIATATKVDKVLIEEMDVRELAGKPERFEYALTIREFIPTPKPEQEPPPPPPPPPPKLDTGKLVVEVAVEGQPGADVSKAIVTLEGTKDDGSQLARTLTNRSNNVWNDDDVPPGSYTAKAMLTASPSMSGTADAKIRAGETTKVTIILQPGVLVAKEFIVHFRFDKAFVEPCMREVLQQVVGYANDHKDEKLVIVGHTDLVGSPTDLTGPDPYNQSLSERRARSVYAFLTFGSDQNAAMTDWNAFRQKQTSQRTLADNWGTRQYQHMLQDLGFYPGNVDGKEGKLTQDAVRAFRRKHGLPDSTTVDDAVWTALIQDYLGQDNFAVADSQFLRNCGSEPLKWLGCASQDPVNRTRQAHRPNRRVELLFVNTDKFPCSVPQPDTFDLPTKGAVGSGWCLNADNKAQDSKRACFVVPHLPPGGKPTHGEWPRQPAEPGSITVQVTVKKEVRKEDGTTELQPVAGQKFVVIAADGEFQAGELSSGEPQPAVTKSDGTQTFSDKPVGIYCLEVLAPVLVRLADEAPEDAKGNAVCKHLTPDDSRLDVVILPDPALREIRLPAAAHLMTALHPLTREVRRCPVFGKPGVTFGQATLHDEAEVRTAFNAANDIWRQARVHFDLGDVVEEIYSFSVACEVTDQEFEILLQRCAYPHVVNVFFVGAVTSVATPLEPGLSVPERGLAVTIPGGSALSDRLPLTDHLLTDPETGQTLAHELGHFLTLEETTDDPANDKRLMFPAVGLRTDRTLLVADEIATARASQGAAFERVPLQLKVTGAKQVGGIRSHEFIVIQNPAIVVTVDAQISDELLAEGAIAMTGGSPGANDRQRTLSAATAGVPVEVVATYSPTNGTDIVATRAIILVATFQLRVEGDGVKQIDATTFAARRSGKRATVIADVQPVPFCVPKDLVTWQAGDETFDPLRHTVSMNFTTATTVRATIAGVTNSVTIVVFEIALVNNAAPPLSPALANVQIEGVLNQDLKNFDTSNLFDSQPKSLFQARATLPTVAGNTLQATLTHKAANGTVLEAIPITLTKKADAFLSLPILAIPAAIKANEITLKQPKSLEVVRAQAGDKLQLSVPAVFGGVSSEEATVRARTVFISAQTFTDSVTTAKDLKATAADIRRQIGRANRIWAQAGIEVKERAVQDSVPDPGGLLQLDDNGTATLTTDEQKLIGLIPGGPVPSPVATDLNVYYLQDIKGSPSGLSFKGQPAPARPTVALEGPKITDAALPHEIGHWLLRGWASPAGIGADGKPTQAGDEHVDLTGKAWPDTNVMHKFDVDKDGNVDKSQVTNILPNVSPVVVVVP